MDKGFARPGERMDHPDSETGFKFAGGGVCMGGEARPTPSRTGWEWGTGAPGGPGTRAATGGRSSEPRAEPLGLARRRGFRTRSPPRSSKALRPPRSRLAGLLDACGRSRDSEGLILSSLRSAGTSPAPHARAGRAERASREASRRGPRRRGASRPLIRRRPAARRQRRSPELQARGGTPANGSAPRRRTDRRRQRCHRRRTRLRGRWKSPHRCRQAARGEARVGRHP